MRAKTLGILGGLGPAASVYFYQLITEHTKAEHDQDHPDIILISGASIPGRTEFIIGKSESHVKRQVKTIRSATNFS